MLKLFAALNSLLKTKLGKSTPTYPIIRRTSKNDIYLHILYLQIILTYNNK